MENNNLTDFAFVMAKMATLNDECAHRAVKMASVAYSIDQLNYFYRLRCNLQSVLCAVVQYMQQGMSLTQDYEQQVKECLEKLSFCDRKINEIQQALSSDVTSMLLEALQKQCSGK